MLPNVPAVDDIFPARIKADLLGTDFEGDRPLRETNSEEQTSEETDFVRNRFLKGQTSESCLWNY
jgi:hypothetical protein